MSVAASLPSTYKAAVVVAANKWELQDRPLPRELASDQVLVKVLACGVCHSDMFTVAALYPGMTLPRVPGHEVIGIAVKVGTSVKRVKVGDRVGRGWNGENCFECIHCRGGDFSGCTTQKVTGIHTDGGYAEYMIAPEHSLASVPTDLEPVLAASLLCAGVTTFNGLRRLKVMPPAVVVVQGVGGLGHLAIQFSRRMGYHTIALSQGTEKRALALELGAHHFVDSTDPAAAVAEIRQLGGADVILATANAAAVNPYFAALARNGIVLALGAEMDSYQLSPMQLIGSQGWVHGHSTGTAADSEQTIKFAKLNDVKAKTEIYPFARFEEAYKRMMTGKAMFRVILKFD